MLQVNGQTLFTNHGTAITIENGITLTIDKGGFTNKTKGADKGTIDNAGTITLTKDWENNSANGVFSTSIHGIVQFIGIDTQVVGGTSVTGTDFYDLIINNNSVAGITLGQPASVTNVLTLTDGIVFSDATNFITMNDGSSVSPAGGVSGSFIDGPMVKTGTTAFVFPVGDSSRWARIGIGAPTAATTFKAEYVEARYANTDSISTSTLPLLRRISGREYWTLDRTAGAGDATVTLYWESSNFSGINNCVEDYLKIAHWNGSHWENNNPLVTYSCGASGSVSTNGNVTSFSPFTFGSQAENYNVNPLPIELISFDVKPNGNKVDLTWVTASEINNDYFTIERTIDGLNYEALGTVQGNGNSNGIINYASEDNIPYDGISYYRIKQTDFDGKYTYSDLKMVNFGKDVDLTFNIYPNPMDGGPFNLELTGNNTDVLLVVHDMLGNEIYSKVIVPGETNDGDVLYSIDPSQQLKPGVYMVSITSKSKTFNKRLVVY